MGCSVVTSRCFDLTVMRRQNKRKINRCKLNNLSRLITHNSPSVLFGLCYKTKCVHQPTDLAKHQRDEYLNYTCSIFGFRLLVLV